MENGKKTLYTNKQKKAKKKLISFILTLFHYLNLKKNIISRTFSVEEKRETTTEHPLKQNLVKKGFNRLANNKMFIVEQNIRNNLFNYCYRNASYVEMNND